MDIAFWSINACHCDLHSTNLFFVNNTLKVFDFDTMQVEIEDPIQFYLLFLYDFTNFVFSIFEKYPTLYEGTRYNELKSKYEEFDLEPSYFQEFENNRNSNNILRLTNRILEVNNISNGSNGNIENKVNINKDKIIRDFVNIFGN